MSNKVIITVDEQVVTYESHPVTKPSGTIVGRLYVYVNGTRITDDYEYLHSLSPRHVRRRAKAYAREWARRQTPEFKDSGVTGSFTILVPKNELTR